MNDLIGNSIPKSWDTFMNRRVEFWNNKEITTTLTVPGTIRIVVGRNIWNKILGKITAKKLVNKCCCFKTAPELYWCIYWCLIQFWLHYFGCTVIYVD